MKKLLTTIMSLAALVFILLPEIALAAAKKVDQLVIVADTRKFSGWEAWWTNLYNESHLYFALLTVALIPLVGFIFGVLADIVMGHIGIDLKSRELAEH